MWLMVLMSGKWYAKDCDSEDNLRDDLDWWCDEMGIDKETVVIVE